MDEIPTGPPPLDRYVVRNLDQAKLLTDPTRLALMRKFGMAPQTTKQVADAMGVPPTRLYRHVHALLEAGLIEVVAERRKRGTTERYLRAVAKQFEVDRSLFAEGQTTMSGPPSPVVDLFRAAEVGVTRSLASPDGADDELLFVGGALRASRERIAEVGQQLLALINDADPCDADGDDLVTYGFLLALYPDDGPIVD